MKSSTLIALCWLLVYRPEAYGCDTNFSDKQITTLLATERMGAPYNLGYTMAAIRMVESSAKGGPVIGGPANLEDASLGAFQVKESTALEILHRSVSPGSRRWTILRTILLTDDFYNGRAAMLHFLDLRKRLPYSAAVAAYNLGEAKYNRLKAEGQTPEKWHYAREVSCYVNYFRSED